MNGIDYYNNTLVIEAGWMVDEGIMTYDNYKAMAKRNRINVVRRGCLNTPALVAYDSMPERLKLEIMKRTDGDPYREAKISQLETRIVANLTVSVNFETYKLDDGRCLPKETRREYYANAIVLDAIHTLISDKRSKKNALGHKAVRAWEQIGEAVQELDRNKYPHSLPANHRRLEERYKKYQKEGWESLIHKNFMNKNSAKVDEDVKESFLAELMADPRNLDNAQVMSLYNMLAEKMAWKKITASTVALWRDKLDVDIYAGRRGGVSFANKKTMHVKRSAPTCPLYYWTLDGWDVELLYQVMEKGRTTYHHRPTVVVVLDAFNKYPLGYAIGTHETPELTQAALRNAAKHTAELLGDGGRMYRVHQLQSDHYAFKALSPVYEAMSKHVTPARVKNAKAKIIEPYFKSINKKYCQLKPNWAGFGITAKKESQPNNEYLNKYKHSFPEWDGVVAQVIEILESERAEKREAYLQKWAEMPEADKLVLENESYLLTFGQTLAHSKTGAETKVMLQDNGVNITINGIKRDYDCFDLAFRRHYSVRWSIRYDPDDVRQVLAVNDDESLRFMLTEKYVQPMALKDRKPGDGAQLQKVDDFNASLAKQATDFRAKNIEVMGETMSAIRQIDTLNKLMLTDSNGQHKDRRNEGRGREEGVRGKRQEVRGKALKSRAVDVVEDLEADFREELY